MSNLILGATTRPWHQFSLDAACAAIAESGYTDMAFYANEGKIPLRTDSTPGEIETALATVSKHGLKASMLLGSPKLNVSMEEGVADLERLVDIAADAGIRYLMNGGTENAADLYFDLMRRVAPYAEKKGVEFQLKPHGGIGLTGADLKRCVERVGHSAFTICYDPGNIIYYTRGAQRPEPDVRDCVSVTTTCIIKDCVVNDGTPDVWIQPTTGLVDFKSVLGTLVQGGFAGPLYVECLGGNELDDINHRSKETFVWLRDLVALL